MLCFFLFSFSFLICCGVAQCCGVLEVTLAVWGSPWQRGICMWHVGAAGALHSRNPSLNSPGPDFVHRCLVSV